jgi:hypothetical protein
LKVREVLSNSEENFCLKACVLGRHESIVATPDPNIIVISLRLFAKRLAKGKLGGVVDGG